MPQLLPSRDIDIASESRDVIARALARAALAAGPAVMEEYARQAGARSKADGSPVTAADERAEEIIRERLIQIAPATPIVAEEATAAGVPLEIGARFFLVDPLDGTREFLARNGEFTINVALIEGRAPVAGAIWMSRSRMISSARSSAAVTGLPSAFDRAPACRAYSSMTAGPAARAARASSRAMTSRDFDAISTSREGGSCGMFANILPKPAAGRA